MTKTDCEKVAREIVNPILAYNISSNAQAGLEEKITTALLKLEKDTEEKCNNSSNNLTTVFCSFCNAEMKESVRLQKYWNERCEKIEKDTARECAEIADDPILYEDYDEKGILKNQGVVDYGKIIAQAIKERFGV